MTDSTTTPVGSGPVHHRHGEAPLLAVRVLAPLDEREDRA